MESPIPVPETGQVRLRLGGSEDAHGCFWTFRFGQDQRLYQDQLIWGFYKDLTLILSLCLQPIKCVWDNVPSVSVSHVKF